MDWVQSGAELFPGDPSGEGFVLAEDVASEVAEVTEVGDAAQPEHAGHRSTDPTVAPRPAPRQHWPARIAFQPIFFEG